jgi:hypothetical protein
MSIESFIKNLGSKIGTTAGSVVQERARRLNDPTFQIELNKSRTQFVNHLSTTGSHTLDVVYKALLRGPGITAWAVARNMFDPKTNFADHVTPKIIDEIASTVGSLGKMIYHGTKMAGRGTVHTLRWLFAK